LKKTTILSRSAILLSSVFFISIFTPTHANEKIRIHHQLISHSQSESANSVTLTLFIENRGDNDITNVKLFSTGNEFSVNTKNKSINIGHLPSQGESVIQWTTTTPVEISYFKKEMPIFFQLHAKQNNNELLSLSLYSRERSTFASGGGIQ